MTPERGSDTGPWFALLSQELMTDLDLPTMLDKVCCRALDVVPAADFVGITVRRRRGRLETQACTDEMALRCDELQYELAEGPCVDAALEDEPFLVHSTAQDPRWPTWGPAVAEIGVHSLISVQLPATVIDPDRDPLGAVNIYGRKVDAFDDTDLERAKIFALHAGNALTTAHQVSTLTAAVEARHHIGVAQGVLASRYGIDVEQAFELLQRYSSHANVKLRDVATLVSTEGELPASYEDVDTAPSRGPDSTG